MRHDLQAAAYERPIASPGGPRHIEVNLIPHVANRRPIGCFVLIHHSRQPARAGAHRLPTGRGTRAPRAGFRRTRPPGPGVSVMAAGQETTYESVIIDREGQRTPVEFILRTMHRNGERMHMSITCDLRAEGVETEAPRALLALNGATNSRASSSATFERWDAR